MTKRLTEGKPIRLILSFAFPIWLSFLFQQMYNLVDTLIVGRTLGSEALAAVGATGSINFMIIGFCLGVCSGCAIPMSHAFGRNDEDQLKRCVGNCAWLCAGLAVLFAFAAGSNCHRILVLMNTPSDIIHMSEAYASLILWGIPVTVFYNMLSGMIRAVGDSKTPVYFLAISSILNIILDFVLILWVKMGIAGAAAATLISQGVSALLCLVYMTKRFPVLQPKGKQWKPDIRIIGNLCNMGIPMGLQYSITAIGSTVLQRAVNGLGTEYVAAMVSAVKVQCMFVSPYDAFGSTAATFSGQNIGAGKPERIKEGIRDTMLVASAYSILVFLVYLFLGDTLIRIFVDGSKTLIIENAKMYLLRSGAFYIPLAGVNIYRFSIQGLGHSQIAMTAGVLEMVGRSIAAMQVTYFGFKAVCFASPIAWVLADCFLIPGFFYFIRKEEKKLGLRP